MAVDGSSGQDGQWHYQPILCVSTLTPAPEAMGNSRQRCLTVIYKVYTQEQHNQVTGEKNPQK